MDSRLDQTLDRAPAKRSVSLPPARELLAFGLTTPSGTLHKPPRPIRCPGCAARAGGDGAILCVMFTDGAGCAVLCYYHSKGNKNGTPLGRWLLITLAKGAKARVVCEHGHGVDIGL